MTLSHAGSKKRHLLLPALPSPPILVLILFCGKMCDRTLFCAAKFVFGIYEAEQVGSTPGVSAATALKTRLDKEPGSRSSQTAAFTTSACKEHVKSDLAGILGPISSSV